MFKQPIPSSLEEKNFFPHLVRSFIASNKVRYFLGALSVIILDGIEMLPALALKDITDSMKNGSMNYSVHEYAFFFLGCYLVISLLRFAWRFFIIIGARDIEVKIKNYLFQKLLHGKFSQVNKLKIGDTVSMISQDVSNIRMFMGPGILVLVDTLTYLVFIPATLFYVLGKGAIFVVLPFILITVMILILRKPLNTTHEEISTTLGKMSDQVYEESVGAKIFKMLELRSIRRSKFQGLLKQSINLNLKVTRLEILFESLLQIVILMAFSILFYLGYQDGQNVLITMGAIAVAVQLLQKLVWPMMAFSYILNFYQMAKASGQRIYKIALIPDMKMGEQELPGKVEEINLTGLSFSYAENLVLENIHFKAGLGQKIGIVGAVGSGKSTLLRVLASLYDESEIQAGEFQINNIAFKSLKLESYRNQLSYIPQENHTMSQTLRKNIAPMKTVHPEELERVIELADLTHDLELFPEGVSTYIGEKGVNLSGGQKQRVAIARSFYAQSSLYLWDDAISALDYTTEKKIIQSLYQRNKDSILILATHRVSSLENFDLIYVIEKGQIIEQGTYAELMQKAGAFYHMSDYEKKTRALKDEPGVYV